MVIGTKRVRKLSNTQPIQRQLGHYTKGLELVQTLPDTPERIPQELDIRIALGSALIVTKGFAAPEVEHIYNRARALCQQVEDSPQLFRVLVGLRRFYLVRGELRNAHGLAEQLLALATSLRDPEYLLEAHFALVMTLYHHLGAFASSYQHAELGLALYNRQEHRSLAFTYGIDPGVHCLTYAAGALWVQGYAQQGIVRMHEALTLAHELDHPFSLARALLMAADLH